MTKIVSVTRSSFHSTTLSCPLYQSQARRVWLPPLFSVHQSGRGGTGDAASKTKNPPRRRHRSYCTVYRRGHQLRPSVAYQQSCWLVVTISFSNELGSCLVSISNKDFNVITGAEAEAKWAGYRNTEPHCNISPARLVGEAAAAGAAAAAEQNRLYRQLLPGVHHQPRHAVLPPHTSHNPSCLAATLPSQTDG